MTKQRSEACAEHVTTLPHNRMQCREISTTLLRNHANFRVKLVQKRSMQTTYIIMAESLQPSNVEWHPVPARGVGMASMG